MIMLMMIMMVLSMTKKTSYPNMLGLSIEEAVSGIKALNAIKITAKNAAIFVRELARIGAEASSAFSNFGKQIARIARVNNECKRISKNSIYSDREIVVAASKIATSTPSTLEEAVQKVEILINANMPIN